MNIYDKSRSYSSRDEWKDNGTEFFLPIWTISKVFRGKYMDELKNLWNTNQLEFHGTAEKYSNHYVFKELIDFCLRTLAQSPELRIPIGRTSKNKTRQLKYNAVSGIAIVCRAAMIGGAPEIECYARSDSAIMRIDETDNELTILKILIQTTIDYATLVQKTKSTIKHPQVIRKCVQYIASHTHENITLEQLAEGSEYSKE